MKRWGKKLDHQQRLYLQYNPVISQKICQWVISEWPIFKMTWQKRETMEEKANDIGVLCGKQSTDSWNASGRIS